MLASPILNIWEVRENIYHEKLTIQDGLKDGGILFLNGDDPLLKDTKPKRLPYRILRNGENLEYRAEGYPQRGWLPGGLPQTAAEKVYGALKHHGTHNVLNAMVALAVADLSGVPLSGAVKSLAAFTGFKTAEQIAEKKWSYHH